MSRPLVVTAICTVVIIAGIVRLATRPRSEAAKERDEAGWRVCRNCEHEWHMSIREAVRQSKQNPDGQGWVKCPKCDAWQGMPGMVCPKCERRFPLPFAIRNEEYVFICTYCDYAPPLSSLGGGEGLPEEGLPEEGPPEEAEEGETPGGD